MKFCFLPVSNGIGDILAIPIVVVRDEGEGTRLIQVDEDGSRHKACPMKCEPFCPMIIFRMSFVLVFLRPKEASFFAAPKRVLSWAAESFGFNVLFPKRLPWQNALVEMVSFKNI